MRKTTINPAAVILPILAAIVILAIYLHSAGIITMSSN